MAHLFSKIVLKDALKNISIANIEEKISILAGWNEMYKKGELQRKNETEFEATYSEKLFGTVLGYNDVSSGLYTREKHPKNSSNGQKCDIGLGYYSSEKNETQAVVELKDAGTSIDRPQQREGNMTPIQQGFKYKPLYNSRWVIVSNYYEIRLYRDTYQDFEVWTLSDLVNPANDYEKFRIFYLLLRAESLISETGESETEKLLAKVRIEQETITKKFYKEYSGLREELMRDIWKNNPTLRNESVVTITQRIIDRIVFIHFCEDRLLLPSDKLKENLTRAKEAGFTPWEILMVYFRGIDKGSEKLGIPDGYNGGLFRDEDEVIKNLKVSDEVITKFIELGRYDFSDEGGQLSVEILGHIFEQSISDLESIRTKIKNPGGESDEKKVSKRKKDGIFYTPAYIVDYIVRNSLGKYLEENEERLKEQFKLKGEINEKNYRKRELEAYTEYQKILHNVKVVDPACGSGAFLVRVFDFLISENVRVDKILSGDEQTLSLAERDPSAFFGEILKNNIYGVDLNEESVEITKLSLWLKSAVRGKKLETLDNNIKCGNSLIDNPLVAGDKAFNWNTEFPDIMACGGFDVIVGNPPYVKLESLKDASEGLGNGNYITFDKRGDLYVLFVERGFSILKQGGSISYIMPNKWLQAGYGGKLRKYFLTKQLEKLIDFGDIQIFEGATTYPVIFVAKNDTPKKTFKAALLKKAQMFDFNYNIDSNTHEFQTADFSDETWVISSKNNKELLKRLESQFPSLKKFVNGEANYGIKPGLTEAFIIDDQTKNKIIQADKNSESLIGKVLKGRDLKRYGSPQPEDLDNLILAKYGSYRYLEQDHFGVYQHLIQFEAQLKKRGQCTGSKPNEDKPFEGQHHWLELDNNPSDNYLKLFKSPKIMYQIFQVSPCFIFDETGLFCNNSMWILPTENKGLLAVLNSKMGWWLITKYCTQIQNGCQLIWKYFSQIPIPVPTDNLAILSDTMISLNRDIQEKSSSFLKNIQAKFDVSKITRKLEKWWELDFTGFLKESKISVSLTEQEELMRYFETRRAEVRAIDTEIHKTDTEIDNMVFELYSLTEEEIAVVKGNTNIY